MGTARNEIGHAVRAAAAPRIGQCLIHDRRRSRRHPKAARAATAIAARAKDEGSGTPSAPAIAAACAAPPCEFSELMTANASAEESRLSPLTSKKGGGVLG